MGEDSDSSSEHHPAKCEVTGKGVIDDCHITIEFGYGSELDMNTYTISPVCEDVGKALLKFIQIISPKSTFNIESYKKDMIDDIFREKT